MDVEDRDDAAPHIWIDGVVIQRVLDWCGAEGLKHIMLLGQYFPEAKTIMVTAMTKRSDADPVIFYAQVDTPVDNRTFRDQRAKFEIRLAMIGSSMRGHIPASRSSNTVGVSEYELGEAVRL